MTLSVVKHPNTTLFVAKILIPRYEPKHGKLLLRADSTFYAALLECMQKAFLLQNCMSYVPSTLSQNVFGWEAEYVLFSI